MRVSDHNETIVDMITCVYDSLYEITAAIIEKSIFHVISANVAHDSINKVYVPFFRVNDQ